MLTLEEFRAKDMKLFDKLPGDVRAALNYTPRRISAWGAFHALHCPKIRKAIQRKMARYIRINGTYPRCKCKNVVSVDTGTQGDIR